VTVGKVVLDLLMHGADRGVVVRHGGKGVIVLMLDAASVASLGRALLPLTNELGTESIEIDGKVFDGRPSETITTETTLKRAFEHCDESPRCWLLFQIPLGNVLITGVSFVGEVCDRVAAICNAHACPCSLDPTKRAPGYEIERTIHRSTKPSVPSPTNPPPTGFRPI
jgi:hypothetical protein